MTFNIVDKTTGKVTGKLKKQSNGLLELCLGINIFAINFPEDASPENKAALLAALFLIDFSYFEKQGNGDS